MGKRTMKIKIEEKERGEDRGVSGGNLSRRTLRIRIRGRSRRSKWRKLINRTAILYKNGTS